MSFVQRLATTDVTTVLDANVIIACFNPEDTHHSTARNVIRTSGRSGQLAAHSFTVAEAAVGAFRNGHLEAFSAALAALRVEIIGSDPSEPWRLARVRSTFALRMTDCCVIDVAQRLGGSLATFDTKVANVATRLNIPLET